MFGSRSVDKDLGQRGPCALKEPNTFSSLRLISNKSICERVLVTPWCSEGKQIKHIYITSISSYDYFV